MVCDFIAKRTGKRCGLPPTASGRCKRHTGVAIWYTKEQAEKQGVSYPTLTTKIDSPIPTNANIIANTSQVGECCVCLEECMLVNLDVCTHKLCRECLDKLERRHCPMCRTNLKDYNKEVDVEVAKHQRAEVEEEVSIQLARKMVEEQFKIAIERVVTHLELTGRVELARYLRSLPPQARRRFITVAARGGW